MSMSISIFCTVQTEFTRRHDVEDNIVIIGVGKVWMPSVVRKFMNFTYEEALGHVMIIQCRSRVVLMFIIKLHFS